MADTASNFVSLSHNILKGPTLSGLASAPCRHSNLLPLRDGSGCSDLALGLLVITVRKLLPKRLTRVRQSSQPIVPDYMLIPSSSTTSPSLQTRKIADADVAALNFRDMCMTAFYGSCVMERATMPAPRLVPAIIASSDECAFTGAGCWVRERMRILGHRGRMYALREPPRQVPRWSLCTVVRG
jgi:hypothetical protein